MKKLKTLFFLGLFALVVMPLKAQPPDYPPEDLGTSGEIPEMVWQPDFIWEIQNETDCAAKFQMWFHTTGPNCGPNGEDHKAPEIIFGGMGTTSITSAGLASIWGHSISSITAIASWIQFGSQTGWTALYPFAGTFLTGQGSPCDCFRYEFDFSQSGKAILRIFKAPPCP